MTPTPIPATPSVNREDGEAVTQADTVAARQVVTDLLGSYAASIDGNVRPTAEALARFRVAALSASPVAADPDRFEAWWATSKRRNRELIGYSDKKILAYEAFSAGQKSVQPADRANDEQRARDDAHTIAVLRRALAWHGDPQRMATTREEWQQEVDAAIAWVKANPEPDRSSFSTLAFASPVAGGEVERLREALEQIAGNNWKDQSRARHVARATLSREPRL